MYSLPKTGVAIVTVGGVALARPILAVGVAAALLVVGVALRVSGRRGRRRA